MTITLLVAIAIFYKQRVKIIRELINLYAFVIIEL